MSTSSLLQQADILCENVLQFSSGLELPRGGYKLSVVAVFLYQANERLYSVNLLINNNFYESSTILSRSLFELAVNLTYISKDDQRLNEYLKHGGIPLTIEELKEVQTSEGNTITRATDVLPKHSWKKVKDMCVDLGQEWLQEYGTYYAFASIPTHSGSLLFGRNYMKLLRQESPTDFEKSSVLLAATDFHLRIAMIAANVFPKQVKSVTVTEMMVRQRKLEFLLAEEAK